VRRLTTGDDTAPASSPDGRRVLFGRGDDIWPVRAKGGKAKRFLEHAQHPTWSR
jgi:hypothetical protein